MKRGESKLRRLPGAVVAKRFVGQCVQLASVHIGFELTVPHLSIERSIPVTKLGELLGGELFDFFLNRFDFVHMNLEVSVPSHKPTALATIPQDTALFLFQKTVDLFCKSLSGPDPSRTDRSPSLPQGRASIITGSAAFISPPSTQGFSWGKTL